MWISNEYYDKVYNRLKNYNINYFNNVITSLENSVNKENEYYISKIQQKIIT